MTTEVYNWLKRNAKLLIQLSVVTLALLALIATELKLELGIDAKGLNLRVETHH